MGGSTGTGWGVDSSMELSQKLIVDMINEGEGLEELADIFNIYNMPAIQKIEAEQNSGYDVCPQAYNGCGFAQDKNIFNKHCTIKEHTKCSYSSSKTSGNN